MTIASVFNPIGPSLMLVSGVGASFGLNAGLLFIPGIVGAQAPGQARAARRLPVSFFWLALGIVIWIVHRCARPRHTFFQVRTEARNETRLAEFGFRQSAFATQLFPDGRMRPPLGDYSFSNCLAITSRWISLVPSPMVQSFTSR
jgi:hypothetical protein